MLKVNKLVRSVETIVDGKVEASIVTDTLYVSDVRIDFSTGALYATIQRGTTAADGTFISNYRTLAVTVNPDGSFVSDDGQFTGNPGDVPIAPIIAGLSTQFDQFLNAIISLY